MQNQRSHQEGVASFAQALRWCRPAAPSIDGFVREKALEVGAGKYAQWAICLAAIIEVQTKRQHLLQNFDRRLDVLDAGLHRPGSVSRNIDSFSDRDRPVLMPCHFPIRTWSLVEKNAADRTG